MCQLEPKWLAVLDANATNNGDNCKSSKTAKNHLQHRIIEVKYSFLICIKALYLFVIACMPRTRNLEVCKA